MYLKHGLLSFNKCLFDGWKDVFYETISHVYCLDIFPICFLLIGSCIDKYLTKIIWSIPATCYFQDLGSAVVNTESIVGTLVYKPYYVAFWISYDKLPALFKEVEFPVGKVVAY